MSRNESTKPAVFILLAVTIVNVLLVTLVLAPGVGLSVPVSALAVIVVAEAAAIFFAYNHAKTHSQGLPQS